MIKAEIIAHSTNEFGDELISVLATFPRPILAEMNTHRMLSKNTSSSRAIPFNKMVQAIEENPFIPIAWQKEHSGMQGNEYFTDERDIKERVDKWLVACGYAIENAKSLTDDKVTKQLANRLLEPFMWTTMLITGPKSGWDNFFNLRNPVYQLPNKEETFKSWKELTNYYEEKYHDFWTGLHLEEYTLLERLQCNKGQAEIHMMALAEAIYDAVSESTPKLLKAGEWHIPFSDKMNDLDIDKVFKAGSGPLNREEVRVKSSVAMAARTSYTIVGEEKAIDYQKMIDLHDRLLSQDPPHSSPLEHCAKTMSELEYQTFIKGQTSEYGFEGDCKIMEFTDKSKGWCNNFKGFIPYRYLIDNKC